MERKKDTVPREGEWRDGKDEGKEGDGGACGRVMLRSRIERSTIALFCWSYIIIASYNVALHIVCLSSLPPINIPSLFSISTGSMHAF